MPRAKQNRKSQTPRGREVPPGIPNVARWFLHDVVPLLRSRRRKSRSARHLRNAGIEVLEAVRVLLDETIEWLKEQDGSPELKRIRVED